MDYQVMRKPYRNIRVEIVGGRTHIQHSIYNLIAMPIIWQDCIMIVGPVPLSWSWHPICGSCFHLLLHVRCHITHPPNVPLTTTQLSFKRSQALSKELFYTYLLNCWHNFR